LSGAVFLAGHSLGAARALLYAWSRLRRGLRVDGVYAFAPPNPGDRFIGETYALGGFSHVVKRSFKNRRDLVCDVPVDRLTLGEEYVQPWPLEEMNEPSPGIGPWSDHYMQLYWQGAHKLPLTGAAIEPGAAADQVVALYQGLTGWDWCDPTDGQVWALRNLNGAKLMIARGSATELDWLDDFDALQTTVMGARVSEGFWRGVAAVQDQLDLQLS
jgi:pimeloyl-ACP methyl ester carboxylesterase